MKHVDVVARKPTSATVGTWHGMKVPAHPDINGFSPSKGTEVKEATPGLRPATRKSKLAWATVFLVVFLGLLANHYGLTPFRGWHTRTRVGLPSEKDARLVRKYHLQIGSRWMNPDGGRWRAMFVCNGQSPCPTLYAEEGDIVELTVHSDSYFQGSIHWAGVGYQRTGAWNDGTAGVSQFPILPRGNYTTVHDTTGAWGLSWYIDHTTAASVDGLYGVVYVAPSPSRLRPYSLITRHQLELQQILESERQIQHVVIKNHQHRDTNWKVLRMRAEGSEMHCYDSLLVNGKGRNLCRPIGFERLNDHYLDETGCIQPQGLPNQSCTPSDADFEVIETNGRQYIMLNLINIGFEHEVKVSVDSHKMIIVANDGGFVTPEEADVLYIPSAARVTALIKLDQQPADYAIRIASTSQLQNLQGFSLLRYPAKHQPIYGEPMKLPGADPSSMCLYPDGSVKNECKTIDGQHTPPFPSMPPPQPSAADLTYYLSAGVQTSRTERFAPEFFLNERPWQLFRSSLKPLLFANLSDLHSRDVLGKPVIHGLPMGAVVDFVIRNELNDTVPLYKHGNPAWLLGSNAHEEFSARSVQDAIQDGDSAARSLNLYDPALVIVHDLPPLGWSVIRFQITAQAATMIHAAKLRHFLLGMSAPILEGITVDDPISVPSSAMHRPHVQFDPKNDGVFG
ncbi:uncharacterized protein JN550_004657 [Neoarthrinium moseri]|uniref:uncharacterized protein n=1 Tax=Neoarthrinium moseri TaxID=1658444 RepID=UPI001FDC77BE|nr:uncharacterized protein JN550_004657 [Neoarthrinium moseri]KAI1871212.1 hypothetical protein JN550_004657 [Neoarthrinium moseri]